LPLYLKPEQATKKEKEMPAITRIEILDWVAMGKKIAEWAKDPSSRPKTVAEMKDAIDGIALVPSRITKLKYVQSDLKTMLMRLPNKKMLAESEDLFASPTEIYPMPTIYETGSGGDPPSNLEKLYSRIADYTIAQCR
jgi:hypothetical protein